MRSSGGVLRTAGPGAVNVPVPGLVMVTKKSRSASCGSATNSAGVLKMHVGSPRAWPLAKSSSRFRSAKSGAMISRRPSKISRRTEGSRSAGSSRASG